ncbi:MULTISPECIES: hypothetical protein [Actinoplanes]|uniref:hypothetical protein n=1 Tax=Actinoplanes TaxID=1865 RepID=UPI0006975E05|nr:MULTISPECIES: hypothetical protein [Actinoplanes]
MRNPFPVRTTGHRMPRPRLSAHRTAADMIASAVAPLGPAWHVVGWPDPRRPGEDVEFLVVGPVGLFLVTVVDHGTARASVAGDVVQIDQERPPYVPRVRKAARLAQLTLSEAVSRSVPVTAVLMFAGSGLLSVYNLPADCLLSTEQELHRLLRAGGTRIGPETARKLARVATHLASSGSRAIRP